LQRDQKNDGDLPEAILIKFDDDSLAQSYTDKLGDSIRIKPYSSTFDGTNDKHITRKMLPIIHAWAVTIHKTQGLTLKKAIICLSGCFGYNMEYVPLSRLTSSNGLFLKDLDLPRLSRNNYTCPSSLIVLGLTK
jgi:hypothetical protein